MLNLALFRHFSVLTFMKCFCSCTQAKKRTTTTPKPCIPTNLCISFGVDVTSKDLQMNRYYNITMHAFLQGKFQSSHLIRISWLHLKTHIHILWWGNSLYKALMYIPRSQAAFPQHLTHRNDHSNSKVLALCLEILF